MRSRRAITALIGVAALVAAGVTTLAAPASAASLQEVTTSAPTPASCGCTCTCRTGSAARPASWSACTGATATAGLLQRQRPEAQQADQYKFIVIFPSVTQATDGCFDVALDPRA